MCFYVAKEFRPMGIGLLLIKRMLSLDIDFFGDDPTPSSAAVWRSLGLMDHIVNTPFTVLNLTKLRRTANAIHYAQRLFRRCGLGRLDFLFAAAFKFHDRFVYPALKYLLYSAVLQGHRGHAKNKDFREVDHISEAYDRHTNSGDVGFVHGADWVNWELNYPWFTEHQSEHREYPSDMFVANRKLYRTFAVELGDHSENGCRGFFVGVVSQEDESKQKTLKVAEHYQADNDSAALLTFAVFFYARKYGADRVDLSNDLVEGWTNSRLLRPLVSVKERSYVVRPKSSSSPLAIALPKLKLEVCDGHYVFM
jgi:GNAT superfamily N-acetyltransferase